MKFPVTLERSFQVLCVLVALWSVFFVKKAMMRTTPKTEFRKVESAWKETEKAEGTLDVFKKSLDALRQSQAYIDTDLDDFRNIFALPLKVPEQFIYCEECGGKNTDGSTICRHCGAIIVLPTLDSDEDGMPDYWEIKYSLDLKDPDDAFLDPDEDGRNNLQEFRDGTHPRVSDKKGEKPRAETALPFELVKTYQKPVQILFMGYIVKVTGEYNVQINWAGKTDFYAIGDEVRGYVIKHFEKVEVPEPDESGVIKYRDRSYIVCQKKKFPPKRFEKQKIVTDNDVFAKIRFPDTREVREVYIDYVIEDSITGETYKVLDIGLNPPKIIVEHKSKQHILY
jgi:hypothetical protein